MAPPGTACFLFNHFFCSYAFSTPSYKPRVLREKACSSVSVKYNGAAFYAPLYLTLTYSSILKVLPFHIIQCQQRTGINPHGSLQPFQ